ncbi:MAG: WecB/TagA/CpsF family glycosyltransferase [Atribacterota bacterium]|nr:WecB/TagA/CpsF family glycosyltransferase [Atribacterota bacterium]
MSEWIDIVNKMPAIAIAGILMILLGNYDQKQQRTFWVKIDLQSLIGVLGIFAGIRIDFLRNSTGGYWYLTNLSIPITIFWLICITNSVGQTDEIDKLTPIIVLIASVTFFIVSVFQRQGLLLAELLSLFLIVFSIVALFLQNKNDNFLKNYFSKYYMFFGFMLAVIAIVGVLKSTAALTLLTPFLILGYPIIDSSYSFFAEYLKNDYFGNTMTESKLRQRLIEQGFSWRGANIVIILSSVYLSLIVIIISVREDFYLFTAMVIIGYLSFYFIKQLILCDDRTVSFNEKNQKVVLFGVPIDRINCQQAIERLEAFVNQKIPRFVVTPDTLAILRARKDKKYLGITKKADLVTPDGSGVLWATSSLDVPLLERITGIDLINKICELSVEKGFSLYFLGSKDCVVKKAVENIMLKYPGIKITGYHHGYFNKEKSEHFQAGNCEKDIIKEIKQKKPDFLLVGLGVPRQEFWIAKHKDELGVPVCIGIGGSFDVLSGKIPRAPLWMQNHGMEWIFRLIKEPIRVKRVIALPYFIWLVFLGKIKLFFRDN